MSGKFVVKLQHWFSDHNELYYDKDHLLFGTMTLRINGEIKGSYFQQASQDTHDSDGNMNPYHDGDLNVFLDCDSYCDCKIETKLPTLSPTVVPTSSPTISPTSSTMMPVSYPTRIPTVPITKKPTTQMPTQTCEITAELTFPPIEGSTYYGYSNDLVGVKKDGNEELCDWWNKETNWGCTHQGDAMIFNPEDKKWAEVLTSEEVFIPQAQSGNYTFMVYHFFNPQAEGYYTGQDSRDYMNAGILSIQINGESVGSYKKDRIVGVETHLENGMVNPEFDADFDVTVSCDEDCQCSLNSTIQPIPLTP